MDGDYLTCTSLISVSTHLNLGYKLISVQSVKSSCVTSVSVSLAVNTSLNQGANSISLGLNHFCHFLVIVNHTLHCAFVLSLSVVMNLIMITTEMISTIGMYAFII